METSVAFLFFIIAAIIAVIAVVWLIDRFTTKNKLA